MMSFNVEEKLVSCGDKVRIWNLPNFNLLHEFASTAAPYFRTVSWSTDGSALISVPTDSNSVTYTSYKSVTNVYNNEINFDDNVSCAKFNGDSKNFLVGCNNGSMLAWSVNLKKVIKTFMGHNSEINCLHVNSINSHVASGSEIGDILVHNLVSGVCGAKLTPKDGQPVRHLQFSTLKKSLLGSSTDRGNVYLWDVNGKKIVHSFEKAHNASATAVIFSPVNTQLFISVGLDKKLNVYNINSKRIVHSIIAKCPLVSLELLNDGRMFIVGGTQGHILAYDLRKSKEPLHTIAAHASPVRAMQSKVIRSTSKSEEWEKLDVLDGKRSASSSNVMDIGNPILNSTARTLVPVVPSSPEYDVFSPVREVVNAGMCGIKSESSNVRLPSSSSSDTSISSPVMSSTQIGDGIFSPARVEELITSTASVGSENSEFFDSFSQNNLRKKASPVSTGHNGIPTIEVQNADTTQMLAQSGNKQLGYYMKGIYFEPPDLSKSSVGNTHTENCKGAPWSPQFPFTSSFVTLNRGSPSTQGQLVQQAEEMPQTDSDGVDYHNNTRTSNNESTSGASAVALPSQNATAVKVLNESALNIQTFPVQQAGEISQTSSQECLAVLLEEKFEEFRVRMQQPYFQVLAQLVKQHVEMKEEVQALKDKLNTHDELWEEVKKLRAENIRLRTAF